MFQKYRKFVAVFVEEYFDAEFIGIYADELLEDLQSTVASRPLVNGTSTYRDGTTGYREVFKSHHSQSTGKPAESSREYQFEYLNPSNTTSVITERPKSPFFDKVSDFLIFKNDMEIELLILMKQ